MKGGHVGVMDGHIYMVSCVHKLSCSPFEFVPIDLPGLASPETENGHKMTPVFTPTVPKSL